MVRRIRYCAEIALAVGMSLIFCAHAESAQAANPASQQVCFVLDEPAWGLTADFSADVTWDQTLETYQGIASSISYSFAPGPASMTIDLSLEDYHESLGTSNISVAVPLELTTLARTSISLTDLAGVPESLASLDLTLESVISIRLNCSMDEGDVSTDAYKVTWRNWSDNSVSVLSDTIGQVAIAATFEYIMDLEITLTMLDDMVPRDLSPTYSLIRVVGSPTAETTMDVSEEPAITLSSIQWLLVASALIACIASVFTVRHFLRR